MNPPRETILQALLDTLTASLETAFTASTAVGSEELGSPSTSAGLFLGLPVFGPGIPEGATIAGLSPLTLSAPATANAASAQLVTGFQTSGRRLKMWQDVSAQPAIFLHEAEEEIEYPQGIRPVHTLHVETYLYSKAGQNPDIAPATALNNMLEALEAALAPDDPASGRFTLGGIVFWCRISGQIEKDPGDLDGQAIAMVPIEIIVP